MEIFWIFLAAVVALGISLFQYYVKKGKRAKNWTWFVLLRFVTWFCLFLLLINPKFVQKSYYLEKPNLVLAVDNSSSIATFGAGKEVENFVSQLQHDSRLKGRFNIDVFSFGEGFRRLDSLDFSEKQTKIGEALRKLSPIYKKKTAPVVLITDGNQTFGQNYVYPGQEYEQVIFPVVVGDTAHYVDLKVERINVNRYVFLNNKFPVEVFVNYNGTEKIRSEFIIKKGNSVVFRKNLNFSAENTSKIITAELPVNSVGVKTYSAIIKPLTEEKNTANNQQNFAIEAIDQKTNILIVAGILHPDIGALKKAIESNQQRSVTIKKVGDEMDFGKYQLVVLYQPNHNFKPIYEQVENLKLNTFTITGTATDYTFLNAVQHDFKKNVSGQTENYAPVFNKNYSAFQLENIGFGDFPPVKDLFGGIRFNEAAHPILFQGINGIMTKMPLLATIESAEGQRKAYLFGEGLWKWRAKNYQDTRSFEGFDEFVGKLVQYLASNKKRSRLELNYASFYNQGEQVFVEANYFDKNYQFDPRAELVLNVTNKASKKRVERPFLLKNNSYQVNLSDLPPGEYKFSVEVKDQLLSKSGEFTLIDFNMEKQFMNADFQKLQKVATNKNQRVYFLKNVDDLMHDLMENDAFKPVQKSRESKTPLIDWYYLLAIIVAALSIEWFMRKYRGLI